MAARDGQFTRKDKFELSAGVRGTTEISVMITRRIKKVRTMVKGDSGAGAERNGPQGQDKR